MAFSLATQLVLHEDPAIESFKNYLGWKMAQWGEGMGCQA